MEIPLRRAEEMGKEKKQWGMLLCKTMLEMRLALFTGDWKNDSAPGRGAENGAETGRAEYVFKFP